MNKLLFRAWSWALLLVVVALTLNFLHITFTEHFSCLTRS